MTQQDVDLIIGGGVLLPMDPANQLIRDGSVAVSGKTIVAIGESREIAASYRARQVLDASHKVIMPGLVDTYGHAGHGLIKGIHRPNLGWPTGALYFHATTADWWYAEGALSALERLKFGVTCGMTVVGATPARVDNPIFAKKQAQAVAEVGVRGVLGVGPPDPYVSHLPEPWEGTIWQGDTPVRRRFTYEDAVHNSVSIIEECNDSADGRVRVALHFPYLFGRQASHPRIPFTYRDEYVPVMIEKAEEMRDLADRFGIIIHSHIFRGSVSYALEKFGRERVRELLGRDVVFAHANGLADEEIAILGEMGTGIAVVAFTHENILYGPCPVIELLQAGANVTISTDGTAPYTSYDLLREVSRATWTQWTRFNDQRLLPPGKALHMVTIDAARALGLGDRIGSLEPGKRADIILIDLDQPHLTPDAAIPRLLAFYASGHDVDTVIVDGEILMAGRQVLSVDENAIIERARSEATRAFERFPIDAYLETNDDFWQGWRY